MTAKASLRVWLELSMRAVGVFSIVAAALPVLASGLLVGDESDPLHAMNVALPIAGILVATLAYQAFSTVQRAESLIHALDQGPAMELDDDRRRAAFAVYDATRDATVLGFFVLFLTLLGDALYGTLSGLSLATRAPLLILTAGCFQLAVYLTAQSFRSGLHGLVSGIKPGSLRPYRRSLLHRRFGIRILSGVACFASAMYAAFLSHGLAAGVTRGSLTVAFLALVATVGLVGVAAWTMGYNAAVDVRRLHTWVQQLATSRWPEQEDAGELQMRNLAAQALSQAVAGLARDFAGMTAAEVTARRSVEQAERLKTRFLSYMSHDLRGPINAIRGFADLLERGTDGPLNGEQLENVRIIRSGGDELSRLVTDVIDWSRLEAGRLDLRLESTAVRGLAEAAATRASTLLERRGIRLSTEIPAGVPFVQVDPARMEQALVAIVEFLGRLMQGGEMTLIARHSPGVVEIELAPNQRLAVPMDEDIFRPFLDRRDAVGRRIGLSLGPALAKALVEAHGGQLRCSVGGRFTFSLSVSLA